LALAIRLVNRVVDDPAQLLPAARAVAHLVVAEQRRLACRAPRQDWANVIPLTSMV
jgi:enoyl-CoA hydratase/carnithine racemase